MMGGGNNYLISPQKNMGNRISVSYANYRIRSNYYTMCLGFSKLLTGHLVKYLPEKARIKEKQSAEAFVRIISRCLCGIFLINF